jgi:TfoX/Sxy family transcriptional regulator of competence genes
MTKWEKSPESLVQLFDRVVRNDPAVERRKMFGYPCAFVNGNMFTGLFGKEMFVRLAAEERLSLIGEQGAEPFEPMPGRPMKDYVVVPPDLMTREAAVIKLVARSLTFAMSLAPKIRKTGAKKPPGGKGGKSAAKITL